MGAPSSLGLGLIFAWLGVYGTSRVPFPERFVFWTTTMVAGAGGFAVVEPIIWGKRFEQVAADFQNRHHSGPHLDSSNAHTRMVWLNRSPPNLYYLSMQYGYVLVISLIITSASYLLRTREPGEFLTRDQACGGPVSTFLQRLPVKFHTAELYAISSEDHYLRVHTSLWVKSLILMRWQMPCANCRR